MEDLRLVEYTAYLVVGVGLTLFVGRVLYRSGGPFLADALRDRALADSINRLLIVGFYLIGLGGVALLLAVDSGLASAADVVKAVVIRTGVLFLVLGALHLVNLAVLRRMRRSAEPAAAPPPQREPAGRFPY